MKKLTGAELVALRVVAEMVEEQTLSNPRGDPFPPEEIEALWYMAHDRAVREFGGQPDPDSPDEVERVRSVVSATMTRICDPIM